MITGQWVVGLALLILLAGCNPSDRRPGFWLQGDSAPFPVSWAFTETIPEIAVQVGTPYLIPHSITIWCVSVDGDLFIAAGNPETKRWPAWVDDDPLVRLRVKDQLYDARLEPLTDATAIAPVQSAYLHKYDLDPSASPRTSARYWRVLPRARSD